MHQTKSRNEVENVKSYEVFLENPHLKQNLLLILINIMTFQSKLSLQDVLRAVVFDGNAAILFARLGYWDIKTMEYTSNILTGLYHTRIETSSYSI